MPKEDRGYKKPTKVWTPENTCRCVLTYTDLSKLGTIPADKGSNRPIQVYDKDGHFICQVCEKDWKFTNQRQPKNPKEFMGYVEANGFAWHCSKHCGVDVCMACAFDSKTIPEHARRSFTRSGVKLPKQPVKYSDPTKAANKASKK
jgi:hypothetical protein